MVRCHQNRAKNNNRENNQIPKYFGGYMKVQNSFISRIALETC